MLSSLWLNNKRMISILLWTFGIIFFSNCLVQDLLVLKNICNLFNACFSFSYLDLMSLVVVLPVRRKFSAGLCLILVGILLLTIFIVLFIYLCEIYSIINFILEILEMYIRTYLKGGMGTILINSVLVHKWMAMCRLR